MNRPFHKILFYKFLRWVFRLSAIVLLRYRFFGVENYPQTGAALVCSNHQSNLDPALVGMTSPRHLNYLAKHSLFRFPLSIIIHLLDAIPLDRDGIGIAGIKETLKRTRQGQMTLIFPEGQRTSDGNLGEFMSGFATIARRTGAQLVPVGLDGAWQAWPRSARLPKPGTVVVVIHPPIAAEELRGLDDDQVVRLLKSRIEAAFAEACRRRRQILQTG